MLHREIGALEIDGEDVVPGRLRHFDDAAELGDADVVVKHVDAAVRRGAGLDHRRDVGGFARVGAMRERVPAFALDDRCAFRGGSQIDVGAEHARALARERDRRGLAVAPARPDRTGADDERHLALEPIGHVTACVAGDRARAARS